MCTVRMKSKINKHVVKPEPFDGKNFKRWQGKMKFYLTELDLDKMLSSTRPEEVPEPDSGDEADTEELYQANQKKLRIRDWKNFRACGYILDCLTVDLYDVYCIIPTAKEQWKILNKK